MSEAHTLLLIVCAYVLLGIWGLWVMFVCIMRLQMLRDAGTLTLGQKLLGYPTLAVGLLLDLLINVVVCTVLFVELPREFTVSARLWRHSNQVRGWRKRLALALRSQLLDSADPRGYHSG